MNETYLLPYEFEFRHGNFPAPEPGYLVRRVGPVCWQLYRAPGDESPRGPLPRWQGRTPPYCGKVERGATVLRCVDPDGLVLRHFGSMWHTIPNFLAVLVDRDRAQLRHASWDPVEALSRLLAGEWKGTTAPAPSPVPVRP